MIEERHWITYQAQKEMQIVTPGRWLTRFGGKIADTRQRYVLNTNNNAWSYPVDGGRHHGKATWCHKFGGYQ